MLPTFSSSLSPRERLLAATAIVNGAIALALFVSSSSSVPSLAVAAGSSAVFDPSLARYIDLTHTIRPGMPLWEAFLQPNFSAAVSSINAEGFVSKAEKFTYKNQGFLAGSYSFTTDQIGTQLDAPAHWNEWGATVSDLPPTVSLRPLVVVDITSKVALDAGYHAAVDDVLDWEALHGKLPVGSVVMFRSDWSRAWDEYAVKGSMPATFPGVSLAALKFLHTERSILVHGHEPLDTDMTPSLEGEAWLMHNNFMQIEGVANLHLVPPAGCLLSIGYAKIAGAAGGMARLIAICPPEAGPHGVTIAEAPGAPLPQQPFPLRRGKDGVLVPTAGATPTTYCTEGSGALGCPMPE